MKLCNMKATSTMTQPYRQTHSNFCKAIQFSFSTNFAISFILCKENALLRKLRIMQTGIWYIPINVCNLSLYQICMLFSDSHYKASHIIRQQKSFGTLHYLQKNAQNCTPKNSIARQSYIFQVLKKFVPICFYSFFLSYF